MQDSTEKNCPPSWLFCNNKVRYKVKKSVCLFTFEKQTLLLFSPSRFAS